MSFVLPVAPYSSAAAAPPITEIRRFVDEQVEGAHEPDQLLTRVFAERAHADTLAALPNIDAKLSADMFMRKPQRRATGGVFSSASRRSVALRNLKN